MPSISAWILNTYTYVWIKNFIAHAQRIFISKTQATSVQYYSTNRTNSCFESRFFLHFFAKNAQNKYIRLWGSIIRTAYWRHESILFIVFTLVKYRKSAKENLFLYVCLSDENTTQPQYSSTL